MIIQDEYHGIITAYGNYTIGAIEGGEHDGSIMIDTGIDKQVLLSRDRMQEVNIVDIEFLDEIYELIKCESEFVSIPELLDDFETQL